jgi:hypothetical protein
MFGSSADGETVTDPALFAATLVGLTGLAIYSLIAALILRGTLL